LFYWKYLFNFVMILANSMIPSGFNPCFTGSNLFNTLNILNHIFFSLCFNPCFYWKYLFNLEIGSTRFGSKKVSILVLLEVPLQLKCKI